MALEIIGNIETNEGLSLTSCYARTNYRMNDASTSAVIGVQYFIDKNAYDTGKTPLGYSPHINARYSYNRLTDGEDVLAWTQVKIKEELENLGFSVVITEL